MIGRKRAGLVAGLMLVVLIGAGGWSVYATVQQNNKNAALVAAIKRGDSEAVETLLELGADPNARDATNRPSLWKQMPDILLNAMPVINATPVLELVLKRGSPGSAAWEHRAPIQEALLKHGANLSVKDDQGMTPLLSGCFWDDPLFVQMALAERANVNVTDPYGRTPLIFAADNNDAALIQVLLAQGVNVNARNGAGDSALMYVCYHHPSPSTIKMLLAHGADVNLRDAVGDTALMHAVQRGFNSPHALVKILLDYGAAVNVIDRNGNTPLKYAAQGNRPDLVSLLKHYGAKR